MSRISSTLKSILICCVCFLTTLSAVAKENILHTVEISQNGDTYSLKLKADEMVHFKKRVENKNSAYFELKNVVPSDDIETVYNDVSSLDGVIIQQIDKSKIRIYVNGYMAAKTRISIETAGNVLRETKEIVVNRPRNEYASVAPIEEYEDSDWENNGFNLAHLINSIKGEGDINIDWTMVVSFFAIVFSVMGVKRAFSKAGQSESAIGISPNTRKIADELGAPAQAKNAREELLRTLNEAHTVREQVGLNTTYARPDATRQNYAINSYNQAQNFNPYADTGATINSPQRRVVMPNKAYTDVPSQTIQRTVRRPAATETIQPTAPRKANVNMDNMKFLESVTKIYEQSGRKDLAQGIKSNLSKQKIAI